MANAMIVSEGPELRYHILPPQGISARLPSDQYHESSCGDTREWIEPDIRLSLSSVDYFANRDSLLEKVLADAKRRK